MHVCELLFIEVNVCFIHEHLFKYSDGHSTVCRGSVSSTRGTSIRLLKEVAIHGAPWLITPWCSNSAAFAVGIPKRRQVPHRLILGIDRFSATLRIIAPIQTPAQRIERHFTGLVIAALKVTRLPQ